MQYGQLQEKQAGMEAMYAQQAVLEADKAQSAQLCESLQKEIKEMLPSKERNDILENLELAKHDNIALKKSLADYKAGYTSLTVKCQELTVTLAQAQESLEQGKGSRRKTKHHIASISEHNDDNTNNNGEKSGDLTLAAEGNPVNSKRRHSSRRVSAVRKKSAAVNAFASGGTTTTTTGTTTAGTFSPSLTENNTIDEDGDGDGESDHLTRIQLRRLRNDSVMMHNQQAQAMGHEDTAGSTMTKTDTEDRECQVNIDSSQYANVRMGNEEEVVMQAMYKRVAELDDLALDRLATIDLLRLELDGQALQGKRQQPPAPQCDGGTDIDLSEYKSQSYEEFLALKANGEGQRKLIDELHNKIKEIQEDFLAQQVPVPVVESREVQCETRYFLSDAGVQAVPETRDSSTQTLHRTPVSNHQTVDDPFYSYIFKELLDVCKHVVASALEPPLLENSRYEDETKLQDAGTPETINHDHFPDTFVGCKNLISSLGVLRRDLFEEMKYRYRCAMQLFVCLFTSRVQTNMCIPLSPFRILFCTEAVTSTRRDPDHFCAASKLS
jgi:hypothetical protein